jgi:flagellar motor switch protein FliN
LWFESSAAVASGATLHAGLSGPAAGELSALVTGEEHPDGATVKETCKSIVAGALHSAAQAGPAPIEFSGPVDSPMPARAGLGLSCHLKLRDTVHSLAFVPNEALVGALAEMPRDLAPTILPEIPGEAAEIPELAFSPHARRNLQMLLDVDLELSVSFGRTTLLLQEVLKLSSGSIVELNRSASDPVEVLVNNSVVARGEVVVVDGNYGIRITEVVSPRDRIRSLL